MQKEYQFTDEQYLDYIETKDRVEALQRLEIEIKNLVEPLEQVHEKIFSAHRAGHNTIMIEYQ